RETWEAADPDRKDGPGDWITFPDELVRVLKTSPDLKRQKQNRWRVAYRKRTTKASKRTDKAHQVPDRALDALLANIAAGLKRGMPSILSVKGIDHWVVVSSVWLDAKGRVASIKFVDPAGLDAEIKGDEHTYRDACRTVGEGYWSRQ